MGAGTDATVRRGHPILLGSIILFALIELCISAWLTAKYNANHNNPFGSIRARVRFALFCSIWTVIFGVIFMVMFLVSATGSVMTSVAAHFIFLTITWIIWIAAAASITQSLGGGLSCTHSDIVYCGQLNAVEGFAWIVWILVTFMLIVVLIRGITAARSGDGYGGGLVAA